MKLVNAFADKKTTDSESSKISGENGGGGRRGAAKHEGEAALPNGFVNKGD